MTKKTTAKKQESCADRIDANYQSRMDDLRALVDALQSDDDDKRENASEEFYSFPLGVDYVEGGTEYNPDGGYIRYQMSWGGPSDEFRFYVDAGRKCYAIEYAFTDGYDGATLDITGDDREFLMEHLFNDWKDCGQIERWIKEAQ